MQIVSPLQIEPEIGAIAAQLPEAQGHDRRYRLVFLEQVIKRLARDTEELRNLGLRSVERRQNLFAE